MSSDAKIAANRRNALKSTGPRTARGKSKSRLNAVTHGIYATSPVLHGEDEKAYRELKRSYLEHFAPVGPHENLLVHQITVEHWKLGRIDRADVALGKRVQQLKADQFLAVLDPKSASYAYWKLNSDIELGDFEPSPVAANYLRETVKGRDFGKMQFAQLNVTDLKFIEDKVDEITDVDNTMLEAFVPASAHAPQESLDRQRRATMRSCLTYVAKLMELQEARLTVALMPKLVGQNETAQMSHATRQEPSRSKRAANQNHKGSRSARPEDSVPGASSESKIQDGPSGLGAKSGV